MTMFASITLFALTGCTGMIGDDDGRIGGPGGGGPGQTSSAQCGTGAIEPGRSPIRRLTRVEFDNAVRELLADTTKPARSFAPEEESLGFDNNADALGMSGLLAEQIMEASEKLATTAVSKLETIAPACDPLKEGDAACARKFIGTWGKRAWRRALAADEITELLALFEKGRADGGYKSGIELVIQRMLQSPFFVYRVEEGDLATLKDGAVRLTGYEQATRLSFFLWKTTPDDALLSDAESGKLATAEGVAEVARRMMKDPRAKESVANFHAQWLELDKLESAPKDATLFPDFDVAMRAALRKETETLVDAVFWQKGTFDELLVAPYTYADSQVASLYGVPAPSGSGFVKIALDPMQRSGILTQPSILALHAKANQSSPVHRGKFVRERLFCMQLPPPPNDIVIEPPNPDPSASTRERFKEHSVNPACTGCHRMMDPIGFGFEHYDAVGKWRTKDGTFDVDARGEVLDTDADGAFNGAIELGKRLAQSKQVKACIVTQWFRYSYGRGETESDTCSMKHLNESFAKANYDLRELMVALTQTDAFRFRKAGAP